MAQQLTSTGCYDRTKVAARQTALKRQDLYRMYLVHRELESVVIVIMIKPDNPSWHTTCTGNVSQPGLQTAWRC